MQTAADRKWIIKSENRILGPYSFDQIEDLLRKKQISLIDEVRDMNTRWLYIRESESLKDVVDSVREELSKADDHTKTFQTRTAQSVTKTGTATQDIVVETKKFEMPTFTNVTVEDVDFIETRSKSANSALNPQVKTKNPSQYVSAADPKVQSQIRESSKTTFLILVSILVGFLVAAGGFYFYQAHSKQKQEQQGMGLIRKYYVFGLENKLVDAFANLNPESQKKILPEIIPMIPKLDSAGYINGVQAITNLKANSQLDGQKKSLLETVDFIQALQNQDIKKARQSLIAAKDFDPGSVAIKENEAILNFIEGKFDLAAKMYSELYQAKHKGRTLFGWAMSEMTKSSVDTAADAKLSDEIERYTFINVDFKKELLLINMLINKRNNKPINFDSNYNDFVSTPLNLRQNFHVPLSVYSGLYTMNTVSGVFEKLKSYLTPVQKFTIDVHVKLELGEVSVAQNLYSTYQNSIGNKNDRGNLRMQVDYALKNYSSVIAEESLIDPTQLNLASHYVLLMSKMRTKAADGDLSLHLNYLKGQRNILGLWSQLMTINDPAKKLTFVQMNSAAAEDFIPFQEIKGTSE